MRLVRLAETPVIVRIRCHGEVTVAAPLGMPDGEVLTLARLVLSRDELRQLESEMATAAEMARI